MSRIIPALFLSLCLLVAHTALASPLTIDISPAADLPPAQVTQTTIPSSASAPTGPPLPLTLTLLGLCCAFLILLGVVILGFIVRRENRPVGKNE